MMPALWILLILFGLSASIYNFYEICICPIASNEDPLIKKDILLVFAIFLFGLGVLFHGIIGLCLYYTGPDFMKGFLGITVSMGVLLILVIFGSLLKKKYQRQIYKKKKKSSEMSRISKNKAVYYFFLVLIFINLFSSFLLSYAEKHSINGLLIGVYIFNLCSLISSVFLLIYHRFIKNKQK